MEEWVAGQLELGGIAANLRYVPNMMNKTAARTWPGRDRAEAGRGRKAVKSHDSQDKTRSDQAWAGDRTGNLIVSCLCFHAQLFQPAPLAEKRGSFAKSGAEYEYN